MNLRHKTLFITGASRGIGLAIALRAARDGANIAIAAKTATPHPKLEGTIHSAAAEIEAIGGRALALVVDVRDEVAVEQAIAQTAAHFGGIDILVNNASAISMTDTQATDLKRYDLMQSINTRGTFLCSKAALPHLRAAANPHILTLSPPLDMQAKWFAPHVAYTIAKFGMSLCTLGHAEEFRQYGIAVNSLWPLTAIDTAAVRNKLPDFAAASRSPAIMADAAYVILTKPAREVSGNFFIDEDVLRAQGRTDFSMYAPRSGAKAELDFFIPDEIAARYG
ncbi:MAG TPA: NAD(P)-dependent oxidoreductase [Rudaea sp.]|jgi:citronellol/citronellal dehydrogenase|uniref:SDR family oxidoreductase n=1 Tax=Rudaea sp. TaxID=2136325 RepID=UPI002F959F0F